MLPSNTTSTAAAAEALDQASCAHMQAALMHDAVNAIVALYYNTAQSSTP